MTTATAVSQNVRLLTLLDGVLAGLLACAPRDPEQLARTVARVFACHAGSQAPHRDELARQLVSELLPDRHFPTEAILRQIVGRVFDAAIPSE